MSSKAIGMSGETLVSYWIRREGRDKALKLGCTCTVQNMDETVINISVDVF
jgi:hypothetical protein